MLKCMVFISDSTNQEYHIRIDYAFNDEDVMHSKKSLRRIVNTTVLVFAVVLSWGKLNSVAMGPTSDLHGGTILFKDLFSISFTGWDQVDNRIRFSRYERPKYVMELRENSSGFQSGQNINIDANKDFLIETTARAVTGQEYFYGVFWQTDWKNTHTFQISPGGVYTVYKNEGWVSNNQRYGETIYLIKRTRSLQINKGNALNKLTVKCSGDQISFFINDQLVNTLPYFKIQINTVGLEIGGQLRVEFERFVVKQR